ncbi:MAG: sugar phosphate nucleotidyltransferase [Gemmatimonadales bacterium]
MNERPDFDRWIVVLAGGIGSRFWPASTRQRPKQFLPLATPQPLIIDTIERATSLAPAENVLIVAGAHLEPHIREHLPQLGPDQLLLEPQARGTAPALAWAAHEVAARARRPESAVIVSLNSDHVIRPLDQFVDTLAAAIAGAGRLGRLVTLGIRPTRPDTGYGYIEMGDRLEPDLYAVRRFVEKPDRATAQGYLDRGGFVWNSGMFIWRPDVVLAELEAHTPEIGEQLGLLDAGDVDGFFSAVPNLTIDYGLMERSSNIAVVEARFDWDDVGAWGALMRVRELDGAGNLVYGDGYAVDCEDTLLWAEDGPVVGFGLSDLVIVRASGITFVMPRARAAELKQLLAGLPDTLKEGVD